MVSVIVAESDDPAARAIRQQLQESGRFELRGVFADGREALEHLCRQPAELVILAVRPPDRTGEVLLQRMRAAGVGSAVIAVVCSAETETLRRLLGLGVTDCLIQPFSAARFQEALQRCHFRQALLRDTESLDQIMVDRILWGMPERPGRVCKGIQEETLARIYDILRRSPTESLSCLRVSEEAGLSQVTVRGYLRHLREKGLIRESIDYETGGRPRVLYCLA